MLDNERADTFGAAMPAIGFDAGGEVAVTVFITGAGSFTTGIFVSTEECSVYGTASGL